MAGVLKCTLHMYDLGSRSYLGFPWPVYYQSTIPSGDREIRNLQRIYIVSFRCHRVCTRPYCPFQQEEVGGR